ncbi:hypothetical protein N0V82_005956 [Gnomoniopsis sp. IMI 355080]|nr:hypothetical protein N0V82_005956 [Gnomoniopsis sp. IMI 355080]
MAQEPDEGTHLFTYEPLPDAATHIRLLQILTLDDDDKAPHHGQQPTTSTPKVHAELSVFPLATAPPYHAISYTWGDPNDTASVLINGKRMVVRRNCEYVLKQAQWYDDEENGCSSRKEKKKAGGRGKRSRRRYFWCDAICIDQGNNAEKGFQVAMMGGIYKGAERVLACVGEAAEGSEVVFEEMRHGDVWLLRAIAALESAQAAKARRTYNEVLNRIGGVDFSSKAAGRRDAFNARLLKLLSALWVRARQEDSVWTRLVQALGTFASREYFRRVWIYQELSLGSDILVCCGKDTAPLGVVYGMLTIVYGTTKRARRLGLSSLNVGESWDGLRQCEDMVEVGCVSRLDKRRLLEALYTASLLKCVDARDRVYGLLSLVEWGRLETPIFPDYTRDVFELGVDVLERLGAFHFRIVMKCLELDSSASSAGLSKAQHDRRDLRELTAPRSGHDVCTAEVPLSAPTSAPFTHAFGLRVFEDEGHLHFTNPSTSGIELNICRWSDYRKRVGLHETRQAEITIRTIVPCDTEVGDWCIFHRSEACDSGWLVLIARCIDSIEEREVGTEEILVKSERRHRFMLRGKGLAFMDGAGRDVTGESAVPPLERAFTDSLGAHLWRRWFDVYCSAEDALCLESSFAADTRVGLETLQDDRLSEYFETRICGQPGSSFAFDVWTHGGVQAGQLQHMA